MRLVQAAQALIDDLDGEDPVLRTALIAAAATGALLSARASSTLPGSRDDAITSLRKAAQALDMTATQARHLR